MAEEIIEQGYRELADTILEHNPGVDLGRVRAAFELADRAHSGQKRKAGTPYVTHCVAAAQICAEMGLDEDSIVAALLHDCIEDTAITHEDIARQFGAEVADIVEGVTKLTRVQFTSREDEQMENLRKMLMAMAKDIRVILIKIADRLHNMRTMEYMVAQKQLEKSLETMEIYAPIAHRLGLQKVKWELEDLSLKYLDPDGYREIITYLDSKADVLNEFMSDVKKKITDRLTEYSIHATVQSRIKHTYSIYRKMYTQKRGLDEIFDLCAFRVIVDDIPDCYNVLGHIHDMFRPVPGRFKDYIATPKPNGYQSVHTTVLGEEGIMFEVQIRTWEMHRIAEYGIAAHWRYKEGKQLDELDHKLSWLRRILDWQNEARDSSDFGELLKFDLFADDPDSGFEEDVPAPDGIEWDKRTKLAYEKEIMKIYVSEHPLAPYEGAIAHMTKYQLGDLAERTKEIKSAVFVGMVSGVVTKLTKRGTKMATFNLEDTTGHIECICFKYDENAEAIQEDAIVKVKGKFEHNDRGNQIMAFEVEAIELNEEDVRPSHLELKVSSSEFDQSRSLRLNRILQSYPGRDGVVLFVQQADGRKFRAELPVSVDARSPVMRSEIQDLFGHAVLTA